MSEGWPPVVAATVASSWYWCGSALTCSSFMLSFGHWKGQHDSFPERSSTPSKSKLTVLFSLFNSACGLGHLREVRALWVRLFKIKISWIFCFSLDLRAQMHVLVLGSSWSKFPWSCGVVGFTAETFWNPVLEKIKSCHFLYGYLHSCKTGTLKIACFLLIGRPQWRGVTTFLTYNKSITSLSGSWLVVH